MAQKTSNPEARAVPSGDRTHFLTDASADGSRSNSVTLGLFETRHSVTVWSDDNCVPGFPVAVYNTSGSMSTKEYMTADEARALARALMLAADHADSTQQQAAEAEVAA